MSTAPTFIGCADWSEVQARTGATMPQPAGLVFAELEPTAHRPGEGVHIVWREGDRFRVLLTSLFPGEEETFDSIEPYAQDRATMFWSLLRWIVEERLRAAGLGHSLPVNPALIAAMATLKDELEAEQNAQGKRVLYTVTCTSGEWDSTHTATVAAYDDLETAVQHAIAARTLDERRHAAASARLERRLESYYADPEAASTDADPDDDDDLDRPGFYRVEPILHCKALPPHLAEIANRQ